LSPSKVFPPSSLILHPLKYPIGLLGLIVGLVALVPKLQSEHGRRLFFEGPEIDEDGDPILGCLWLIPLQILLFTLLGWAGWFISRWLFN
jgi:hypothetical protein